MPRGLLDEKSLLTYQFFSFGISPRILAYQPGFWHIKYVWSTFGSTEFGGVFIRYMCIPQCFLSQPSPPSIPSTTKPRYPYAEADGDLDRIDCVFRGTHPELMGSVCLNFCVISMWKFFIQFHIAASSLRWFCTSAPGPAPSLPISHLGQVDV